MSTPARRYSWPPFEPGNDKAVKHGAWSPRLINPAAADLAERTMEQCQWLQPCDAFSVAAWARVECQIERLVAWLEERGGEIEDDGKVRPAADLLRRTDAQAERLRSRLGLDPLSRARLGLDTARAADLARQWAEEAEADEDSAATGSEPERPARALETGT